MDEKTRDMMEKILESDRIGYAYFYPLAGGDRQEFFISTTAENIANFLGGHMFDADKVIITDVLDRLILDTCGGFLNNCPNQDLCKEIISFLAPIQQGKLPVGGVLAVTREQSDAYFAEEDEMVTMAEYGML